MDNSPQSNSTFSDLPSDDTTSDASRPLLQKVDEKLRSDITMKMAHHSLILEVLDTCNQTSINFLSEHTTPRPRLKSKQRRSSGAKDGFSTLTNYQSCAQTTTFKIRSHFSEVVEKMTELLGLWNNQIETEIWASYEALFFSSTLSDILKVYVLAYDADAKQLQMLLPSADPRNMNLSGERVIDILQSGIPEVDPISFIEEYNGISTGGTSSISTQGSINQAEGAAADTHKHHDQNEAISGEDLEQNSASYQSVSSNLVREMENLYPFLNDVDLEATDQSDVPDDQPVKCIPPSVQLQVEYDSEVKLRHSQDDPRKRKRRSLQVIETGQSSLIISTPQITEKAADEDSIRPLSVPSSIHKFNRESTTLEGLRQLEYDSEVKLRHSQDDPRKRKRRSLQVIETGQSSLIISTPQITEKAADEDSIRPLSVPSSIHKFNRESTTVEDLRRVSSQKVKEDASCEDLGECEKNADSISHVSVIEKRTQTDPTSSEEDDSCVSGKDLTSISRHGFNRQAFYREIKSGKDLYTDWSKYDQDEQGNQVAKWGIGADSVAEHQLECVDSVSHIYVTSNLVEEMENLYPFLRDVIHLSPHLDNLSAIMTESRNGRSEGQGTLPNPGQERYSTNSLLEGPLSFEEMFSQPYRCLRMVLQERFPLAKLRLLVMCLQALTESVKEQVSRKMGVDDYQVGGDDLVPCLIFFLIKGDPGQVTALYPQLKFLEDYIPDAVAGGIIGFTLTQFLGAFSNIIQKDDADIGNRSF
ncbi:uncharacterized protein LOC135155690 isoform X2 [Lytechinus pictus]|uniref:uncharacterized protein LOC135155690 isoform X2 n=1 Tax=Lytechinus pictus TaxID=7653 RepID=UPI0030BA20AD